MHDDHAHPKQPDVEDLPATEPQRLETSVRELLIEKGVFSGSDLRRMIEAIDSWTPALGARLVARAWIDPAFKARLLSDAPSAARELGIEPGPTLLVVLENTPERHNLVVCTLCSCYPKRILGIPPDWYKSRAYRSRAVREPRAVLAEFGTELPAEAAVHVHDSTADLRYLVLPMRPPGTETMPEEELAALVTRDSMIGVALPHAPSSS
jgi:nitrile hydratase subunit alpha